MRLTNLKSLKNHVREWLSPGIRHILSERVGLEPAGPSIEFVDCATLEGSYTVYVDAADIRVSDVVMLSVLVRPGPEAILVPYLSIILPTKAERLWNIDIPGCSGFVLSFTQPSGRPLVLTVHVWKR